MREEISEPASTLSQMKRPILPFGVFLANLISALNKEGVRPCILRNYEGFPDRNTGGDIDFLISPEKLPLAVHAVSTLCGINIVGYTERHVADIFVEGVSSTPGSRSLEVDFILRLTWKKLPYLPVDAVLNSSLPRQAGNLSFFVPTPVHEAINSLFSSLLVGGWLKEKYLPKVQAVFINERADVIATLAAHFGEKVSTRLVDAVIRNNRNEVLKCVRPLRRSLVLRNLLNRPMRTALAVIQHYAAEAAFRYSPNTVQSVYVLGPDGCGKTTMIENVLPLLKYTAGKEEIIDLRISSNPAQKSLFSGGSAAAASTSSSISALILVLWLLDEWVNKFFGKKNLTLRIYDRCYHDLLINSKRYRYGGSMGFARLIGKLFPSPNLWILLDAPVDIIQSINPQLSLEEAKAQRDKYLAFMKTKTSYIIVDASKPIAGITEDAYAAIIKMLTQRARNQLLKRFHYPVVANSE